MAFSSRRVAIEPFAGGNLEKHVLTLQLVLFSLRQQLLKHLQLRKCFFPMQTMYPLGFF